jgi:hypothetical protein
MAGIDDILKNLPIGDIAAKLGIDRDVATKAVSEGGAAILGGLQKNAQTPQGASALEQALDKHAGTVSEDGVDLDAVDTADGEKILGHAFDGKQQEVTRQLNDSPQTAGIDFGKLLPMLAPLVMGVLAKKQSSSPEQGSGGGISDMIGGLLGGAADSAGGTGGGLGGVDIGGLLGGLFGGKK